MHSNLGDNEGEHGLMIDPIHTGLLVIGIISKVAGYGFYVLLLVFAILIIKGTKDAWLESGDGADLMMEILNRDRVHLALFLTCLFLISLLLGIFYERRGEMINIYLLGLKDESFEPKRINWYRTHIYHMMAWGIAFLQLALVSWLMWILYMKGQVSEKKALRRLYVKVFLMIAVANLVLGGGSAVLNGSLQKGYVQFSLYVCIMQVIIAFFVFYENEIRSRGVICASLVGGFWALTLFALIEWAGSDQRHYPYEHPVSGVVVMISFLLGAIFLGTLIKRAFYESKRTYIWWCFCGLIGYRVAELTVASVYTKLCSMEIMSKFGL